MTYPYFYGGPTGGDRTSRDAANEARSEGRRTQSDVEAIALRLDRLALLTEALWVLLRDKYDVDDEELLSIAREIDLSDGRLDGKVRREPVECHACRRVVSNRHVQCLYCGADIVRPPFSDV